MTDEEAIKLLTRLINKSTDGYEVQALNMAINALQENPKLIEEMEMWKEYFEEEIDNEW